MSQGFSLPNWVEARPYQQSAIEDWLSNNGRGVLKMATGTGKTITSLTAAATVAEKLDGTLGLVIAVPYQHLVDQWADDVRDFNAKPILAYQSRAQWQTKLERQLMEFNMDVRDTMVVITTHTTLASEPFQKTLSRSMRAEMMLIADELHHLGAPHLQTGLPEFMSLRLGLSATPERLYDEKGTEALFDYFENGIVYEYPLERAIKEGMLSEYYYLPHVIELTDEEAEEYIALSEKIARLASRVSGDISDADLQEHTPLKHALFKRARLVGTARNKLFQLSNLIEQESGSIEHTLVYCGDGSVQDELTGQTRRHVEAALELLRDELNIRAEKFTAEETQAERERLLQEFEDGDIQTLVAIRCLDEGVDVPATKRAYILASSSNPRQFVQRRGRILRKHDNKQYAVIHDFITVPPVDQHPELLEDNRFNIERKLVEKELVRVRMFSDAARNHPDADVTGIPSSDSSIQEIKREYNLLGS